MKLIPLVLLCCFALVACGGEDEPSAPAAENTPAATAKAEETQAAGGGDAGGEDALRAMFDDYTKALGARDWGAACSHLAPETTEKLKSNVAQLGMTDAPDDCEGLMDTLYTQIDKDPTAKKTIDDITQTAKVSDVKITGDQASVSWSAKVNGVDTPVTQTARIIDGEWKLIDVN
ncbi:hypothetical protein DVA67_024005 [Solirubrobacter sp. CPCC 204708]|uniref:DUF4878 domain-containing protein n=1 Tax=Solirubrobacter deserti TaxID=2282478 RepID=A0ABT4RL22_9ACTN|nr:hypothetical protein [Solirubrobacter deserti]MBE2319060.1 hypothetical protein [Solirubrobacter deserti]MDA0139138.1 hypothetical protein [Solirubrobacter deserti]